MFVAGLRNCVRKLTPLRSVCAIRFCDPLRLLALSSPVSQSLAFHCPHLCLPHAPVLCLLP
jgi:hypothetical protein